jgi:hypothetical protein
MSLGRVSITNDAAKENDRFLVSSFLVSSLADGLERVKTAVERIDLWVVRKATTNEPSDIERAVVF